LCIEEPFDQTNTARSAYDGEIFLKIKDVFFHSFRRLNESRQLETVFTDPLFTQQQQQQMNQMKYLVMNGPGPGVPMAMRVASDVQS
jgi:anthranilate/para-aminobenzoate synthase component II